MQWTSRCAGPKGEGTWALRALRRCSAGERQGGGRKIKRPGRGEVGELRTGAGHLVLGGAGVDARCGVGHRGRSEAGGVRDGAVPGRGTKAGRRPGPCTPVHTPAARGRGVPGAQGKREQEIKPSSRKET